jgi:hypothetical protein
MKKIHLKLYFKKRKQRVSFFGMSPQFDWMMIVSASVIILICGIVYAIYLYIQVNNGSLFEVEEDASVQVELDRKKDEIEKMVEVLKQREILTNRSQTDILGTPADISSEQ